MMMKNIVKNLSLVFLSVFVTIVFLELVLQGAGFIYLKKQEFNNARNIKSKGIYKIMCVGDSMTAIGGDDSYPSILQETLNKKMSNLKIKVINKGVPGFTSAHLLGKIREFISQEKPDLIVVMTGANDEWIPQQLVPYTQSRFKKFFNSLRIVKLVKLLALHFQAKEVVQYSPDINQKIVVEGKQSNEIERLLYYLNAGNYDSAKVILDKKLIEEPENQFFYYLLGTYYVGKREYLNAQQAFEKVLKQNPLNDSAYCHLAGIELNLGRPDNAVSYLNKAIDINPSNKWAYYLLTEIYRSKEDFVNAKITCNKAIKANPQKDWFYGALFSFYNKTGDAAMAEHIVKQAQQIRNKLYNPLLKTNYGAIIDIIQEHNIDVIAMQYPMRSLDALKILLKDKNNVVFADNEKSFKDKVKKFGYDKYFKDYFGGDFGHCTRGGNIIISENLADVIISKFLNLKG